MSFGLSSPVPNPARNEIHADLTLSIPERVEVGVFDVIGNQVKSVLDDVISAGDHSITFDASKLTSGTYALRAVAGGEVVSRRFVIER